MNDNFFVCLYRFTATLHANYLLAGVAYGGLFSLEPDTGKDEEKEAKPTGRLFSGVGSDALAAAYSRVKTNFQDRISSLRTRRQEYVGGKVKALDDDIKEMEARLEGLNPATRTGRFGLRSLKGVLSRLEHRLESRLGAKAAKPAELEREELSSVKPKVPSKKTEDSIEVEDV